ncbi:LysR family transcriptional regulator [Microbacterium betulae]|uniref:LysR family transcriptional regulator n=1 Tax=Microbacterium betulae TaxID=2981139 RepID=A0AA97FGB1_9MICO|nr:LysR family transcriptional regulator [Microbacterium sp. AB]WOF23001.1 LysR family transcriptional regulator [Microbacterium sp. AB]
MDVRHLDLLRELDERGSLAAVALATHRTASAVSQQLRSAERAFGASLVEPAGRGVRLTEAGRLLASCGRDLARAVTVAESRWQEFRDEPRGVVTIATLPSAASFLLPGVLERLADLPIELELADVDIAEDDFPPFVADHDIVIGHSLSRATPVSDRVTTVPLAREPLDIAMSATHPLTALDEVTAHDVAPWPWIAVPPGYPFDTVRMAIEDATGSPLDIRQRLRDNRLIETLVASGDSLAVLPRFTTPTTGGIAMRPLAGIPTGRHIRAMCRPDRAERRAVRVVLDALRVVGASFTAS